MFKHQYLYFQWLRRDVVGRYRASFLGALWPVLQPLLQLMIFTLIFYEFMQLRWPNSSGNANIGALHYGLNVLAGLAVFNFFSEILGRAPVAVLSQPNLVTKVRFPLSVLPVVTVGAAFIHIAVGCGLLFIVSAWYGKLTWNTFMLPIFVLPLVFYGLALAFVLSSIGVYLRDIGQIMPAVSSMLMFLTPIFYPITSVPAYLKPWFELNPIGWGAQSLRLLLLNATLPPQEPLVVHTLLSVVLFLLARYLFKRLEKGFADVL